jgi:hypothetical protein
MDIPFMIGMSGAFTGFGMKLPFFLQHGYAINSSKTFKEYCFTPNGAIA